MKLLPWNPSSARRVGALLFGAIQLAERLQYSGVEARWCDEAAAGTEIHANDHGWRNRKMSQVERNSVTRPQDPSPAEAALYQRIADDEAKRTTVLDHYIPAKPALRFRLSVDRWCA